MSCVDVRPAPWFVVMNSPADPVVTEVWPAMIWVTSAATDACAGSNFLILLIRTSSLALRSADDDGVRRWQSERLGDAG